MQRAKSLILAFLISLALVSSAFGQVNSSDIWAKAALGNVPGVSYVRLHGYNDASTTTFEPFWPESIAYTVLTTAMSAPYCASSSANDDVGSTGCESATVTGITTSYAAFSENITLDGQTSVVLSTPNILFFNSIKCTGSGSNFTNVGNLRCGTGTNTAGVPAVIHVVAQVGSNQSEQAMYGVPDNHKLICRNPNISLYAVTASALFRVVADWYPDPVADKYFLRENIMNTTAPAASSGWTAFPGNTMVFPEKSIVLIQVLGSTGTGPIQFSAECLLVSETNALL